MKLSRPCFMPTDCNNLLYRLSWIFSLVCVRARLCVNRNVSQPRTLTHQKWFTVVANSRERICVYTTTDMADPFQYSLMFSLSSVLINGCFLKVKVCLPSSFPHSDSISRLQLLLGSVARQLLIYYYGIWWSSTGKLTSNYAYSCRKCADFTAVQYTLFFSKSFH